jgi:hypothetical protein
MRSAIIGIGSIFSWIISRFLNIGDGINGLRDLRKPRTKRELKAYRKAAREQRRSISVAVIQLLGVFVAALILVAIIRVAAGPFVNLFWELWHGNVTVKSMIFLSGTILGIAAIVSIIFKLNGNKPVALAPSEATYQFLLEIVFEIIPKIQGFGLIPPSHTNDLMPGGERYYTQGVDTPIYRYTCLKSRDVIDVEKVFRLFKDYLFKKHTAGNMGAMPALRLNDDIHGAFTLIDIKDSSDYITIEIALTTEQALNIQRRRREARRGKRSAASVKDNEF